MYKIILTLGSFSLGALISAILTLQVSSKQISKLEKSLQEEKEVSKVQRQIHGASLDLLSLIHQQIPSKEWEDIKTSKEYENLDSLLEGDWEDFQ